jgi:integrase
VTLAANPVKQVSKPAEGAFENLRFHDLRHEAASRLAEELQAHELVKMMGWKTIQMAMRYYHPRAEDLARKLG